MWMHVLIATALSLTAPGASIESEPGDVVINEIAYAWPGEALEFVEIYNRSVVSYDLTGLTLSDDRRVPVPVASSALILAPGDYQVLVNQKALFATKFPGVEAIEVQPWPVLNNGSDAVVIELNGMVVDSVRYESAWGGENGSLERRNPHVLLPVVSNWGSSIDPSGATPGLANSILRFDDAPPSLLDAEEDGPYVVWARATEPLDPESLHEIQFRVGNQVPMSVAAESDLTSFRLSFSSELDGHVLEVNRLRDLSGNEAPPHAVPIAMIPRAADLVINEIQYDPRADPEDRLPDQTEYVELLNTSPHLLRLRGLLLAEEPDETGYLGSTNVTSSHVYLPEGRLAVVYTVRNPLQIGSGLPLEFEAFGPDAGRDAVWIGAPSLTSRGLSNTGQSLTLLSPGGEVIDEVRYDPAWHSLTLRRLSETRGVALERIDPWGPGDAGGNWTSSLTASGGTPGLVNSASQPRAGGDRVSIGVEGHPSPFSPDDDGFEDVTHFQFQLRNEVSNIRLTIFDLQGRLVRRLRQAVFGSGIGSVLWDGKDDRGNPVAMGMYVVLLEGITAETATTEEHKALISVAGRR